MQILISPLITEKSLSQISVGKYVFEVDKKANKATVAEAIEDLYKVNVTKVTIVNVKGKRKLIRGRYPSKQKDIKKAVVTLKKGQKISGFEE